MSVVRCLLTLSYLSEEVEGEVVVALHQLLFFLCQADVLAYIFQRIAHILSDEEDGTCAAFADDVEERPVGHKIGIAWYCTVLADFYDGHGRCFGAFFVEFYFSRLLHHTDEDIVVAELVEAVATLESIGHTQGFHDIFESHVGGGFELGQIEVHIAGAIFVLLQSFGAEFG